MSKQFRYKEWLFVEVPQGNHPRLIESMGGGDYLKIGEVYTTLPQGQYSIIGKADELGDFPLNSCGACNDLGVWHCAHPEECGEIICHQDFLKSHDMKPNQTIVLKVKE